MEPEIDKNLPLIDFDEELTLEQLLSPINKNQLFVSLSELLDAEFCISTPNGECLLGKKPDGDITKSPLTADMEVVGFIETILKNKEKIDSARKLVELILHGSARYLMASTLHLQAIKDDYEKLQEKHNALQQSEKRYKDLSENLEIRVEEQVKTIENRQFQLYQAEKMASIGQLAAGVAHEINNPMGFIKSNLSTACSYVDDISDIISIVKEGSCADEIRKRLVEKDIDFILEDFQVLLKESIDGANRVSSIVKDLKGFSNIDRSDEEVVDINDVLQGVCNVSKPEISKKAELILNFSDLPATKCKPAHIGQTVLNMLLNAANAIKDNGTITVSTIYENNHILISVKDNGEGIPEDVLPRIFDPFFTTKQVGDGTGLGLSVSHDMIKSHGGEITVESTPGAGTCFNIFMPISTNGFA